jgi:hypothetical protein
MIVMQTNNLVTLHNDINQVNDNIRHHQEKLRPGKLFDNMTIRKINIHSDIRHSC